jgi:hypothetical protein
MINEINHLHLTPEANILLHIVIQFVKSKSCLETVNRIVLSGNGHSYHTSYVSDRSIISQIVLIYCKVFKASISRNNESNHREII